MAVEGAHGRSVPTRPPEKCKFGPVVMWLHLVKGLHHVAEMTDFHVTSRKAGIIGKALVGDGKEFSCWGQVGTSEK